MTQTNETFNLFVYGTLKKGQRANDYLKNAKFIGNATTKDSNFIMVSTNGSYPFVFNCGNKKVSGEIYEVPTSALRNLDYYEGYSPDRKGLYIRDEFDYILEDGKEIKAIMYYQKIENMERIKLENDIFSWK